MVRIRHRAARGLFAVLACIAMPARAEDAPDPRVVMVSSDCLRFWSSSGERSSPAAWNGVLSFAACIQPGTTSELRRPRELEAFVEELQRDLEPSLRFYEVALAEAPPAVQLRAAYYVGLGQVALLTRARSAVTAPALRADLERLLEPHATVAYLVFAAIERAAASDPTLTRDIVQQNMVRSAGELATALRTTLAIPADEDTPRTTRR